MNRYISKKEDLFEASRRRVIYKWQLNRYDQIGRELLIPELPVRVRLLGLRATQLKDLRAEDDPGLLKVASN